MLQPQWLQFEMQTRHLCTLFATHPFFSLRTKTLNSPYFKTRQRKSAAVSLLVQAEDFQALKKTHCVHTGTIVSSSNKNGRWLPQSVVGFLLLEKGRNYEADEDLGVETKARFSLCRFFWLLVTINPSSTQIQVSAIWQSSIRNARKKEKLKNHAA